MTHEEMEDALHLRQNGGHWILDAAKAAISIQEGGAHSLWRTNVTSHDPGQQCSTLGSTYVRPSSCCGQNEAVIMTLSITKPAKDRKG